MAATVWEYEVLRVQDEDPFEIREHLEPLGERGFQLVHVRNNADGSLLMILARNTGQAVGNDGGLLEDGFTDSQMALMAVNWTARSGEYKATN